jgi:hypothetical protein
LKFEVSAILRRSIKPNQAFEKAPWPTGIPKSAPISVHLPVKASLCVALCRKLPQNEAGVRFCSAILFNLLPGPPLARPAGAKTS